MEEERKLKEDIKEARKKIYDNFMNDQTEDNRKDVDMITKLELEKQKNDDELRLREEEAEFNYEAREAQERRNEERHQAEMEKIRLETELARKRYNLEMLETGFNMVGRAVSTGVSTKIVLDVIEHEKTRPFPLPKAAFDAAKRFFERSSRGWDKLLKR